jgi:hypothetical protein
MKTSINLALKCLNEHPKIKQWGWFILLWLVGLMMALSIAYPIKWLMSFLK